MCLRSLFVDLTNNRITGYQFEQQSVSSRLIFWIYIFFLFRWSTFFPEVFDVPCGFASVSLLPNILILGKLFIGIDYNIGAAEHRWSELRGSRSVPQATALPITPPPPPFLFVFVQCLVKANVAHVPDLQRVITLWLLPVWVNEGKATPPERDSHVRADCLHPTCPANYPCLCGVPAHTPLPTRRSPTWW